MTEPQPPSQSHNEDIEAQLYAAYDGWKGWSEPFTCPPEQARYFAAEMHGITIAGTRVLEIGFGNGEFLGWARARGADIVGSERTPSAIAAAETAGITLIPPDFETGAIQWADQFDIIAAFDVFEHLDPATIMAKLRAIDTMLRPGGWLVLRYPNGQSPFGLAAQHGDATHVTALSRAKIEQYMADTSLVTHRYGGVARPAAGSVLKRLVRGVRHVLRDCHGAMMRFIYATDVFFDPVVTHIIAKPSKPKSGRTL